MTSLKNLIKENRAFIDRVIMQRCNSTDIIRSDRERELWIMSDELLYSGHRVRGVVSNASLFKMQQRKY